MRLGILGCCGNIIEQPVGVCLRYIALERQNITGCTCIFAIAQLSFIADHHARGLVVKLGIINIQLANTQEIIGINAAVFTLGNGLVPSLVYIIIEQGF